MFLLLGSEAIKAFKANPYFASVFLPITISTMILMLCSIGDNRIPTWTTPLAPLIFVSALVPNTSFLGHLCGLAIGYVCQFCSFSSAIFKSSSLPSDADRASQLMLFWHRWPWLPQDPCPARKDPSLGRRQAEPTGSTAALRIDRPEDIWQVWRSTYFQCTNDGRWW